MSARRLGIVRWVVPALLLVAVVAAGGLHAWEAGAADWEPIGLGGEITKIGTPASGALFARKLTTTDGGSTTSQLMRSNDGGETWRAFDLPSEFVNPDLDHADRTIVYARSQHGLHMSTDEGATWRLIEPREVGARLQAVAVSPADRRLIYVVRTSAPYILELRRSRDGGASWEKPLEAYGASPSCFFLTSALLAHGIDPARVLLVTGCGREGDFQVLRQSANQGNTWEPPMGPGNSSINRLVGWRGITPARMYAVRADRDYTGPRNPVLSHSLHRGDDDGLSWTMVLTLAGEGAPEPGRWISALGDDPSRPDFVYVVVDGGVRASADGEANWVELGRQDLPRIHDVALGIDGQNLYAATDQGLYWLRLAQWLGW